MNRQVLPAGYENPPYLLKKLKTKPEDYWIKRGEERVLALFHFMAERVPAYKDFLKKNNADPDKIQTIEDLERIPPVDKDNYLRAYPREMLCWDGAFKTKRWVIATTSGSTGEPFYFPREENHDMQYAVIAELYLLNNFHIDKRATLYIDSFAMGAWIGGVFTYEAVTSLGKRGGYHISIITPGIFKEEILKAVKNLGPSFDQILIGGYPPFVKDTIDDGIIDGMDWKQYNLGFIFSAEGFAEEFRDYICQKTGLSNVYTDTLNHYGTVDLGTMAHETPLTIFLRRLAIKQKTLRDILFSGTTKLPTLAQFDPSLYFFEEEDGVLLCSAWSGYPLFRYNLKDRGGVVTFSEITRKFKEAGVDIDIGLEEEHIRNYVMNLPLVYVYERDDFIVKLYGANIYPETIRKALFSPFLHEFITGKFTMAIQFDKQNNQFLEVNIELKKSVAKSEELVNQLQQTIVEYLLDDNSEYRSNHRESPDRQQPKIVLWNYEHPVYFKPGVKQKWVKK